MAKTWLRCYEETLPKEKQELIHSEPNTSNGNNDNSPLLFPKEAMKRDNTQISLSVLY